MTRSDKIEIIKQRNPDFLKINPFLEVGRIDEIKKQLCEAGAYRGPLSAVADTGVINLLQEAQGRKIRRIATSSLGDGRRRK